MMLLITFYQAYKMLQEIYFLLVSLFIRIKEKYSIFQTVYASCNCYSIKMCKWPDRSIFCKYKL